jgi:hypothetical protein
VLHPCSSFTAVCHAAAAGVPMAASDRGNVFASPVKVCPCTGTVVGCTGVLPVQGLYPWTNDLLKTVRRLTTSLLPSLRLCNSQRLPETFEHIRKLLVLLVRTLSMKSAGLHSSGVFRKPRT